MSISGKPRIVISMGDPLGVGPEIIARLLNEPELTGRARVLVLGEIYYLRRACEFLEIGSEFNETEQAEFHSVPAVFSPLKWVGEFPAAGEWTEQSGLQSFEWVRLGAKMCLNNEAEALVTAPICKAAWKAAGADYPGHTELLAELCGSSDEVMMLAGEGLRVALLTIHEPLRKVPQMVTVERLQHVCEIINRDFTRRLGIENPRIAVLGLNPHAGEEGHIGREEVDIIIPTLAELRAGGMNITGPLPADTAFHRMLRGEFDVILAMYHDQGLAPIKTVAFDSGINITLGLPLIRVSVDHGTAFDIAGKGLARVDSIRAAFEYALTMGSAVSR